MSQTYDSACWDLAVHFLKDYPDSTEEQAVELAQVIQTAIYEWIKQMNRQE